MIAVAVVEWKVVKIMSKITTILYFLSVNKVIVKAPFEIIRETPKCYFTHNGVRYLKSQIGVPTLRSASSYPYIELVMVDADEQTLRSELSKALFKMNTELAPKFVRLDVIDDELTHYDERFLHTAYLVNPDEEKLEFLKSKIEHRYDEDGDEDFKDFSKIWDFINENFVTLNIETFNIYW